MTTGVSIAPLTEVQYIPLFIAKFAGGFERIAKCTEGEVSAHGVMDFADGSLRRRWIEDKGE